MIEVLLEADGRRHVIACVEARWFEGFHPEGFQNVISERIFSVPRCEVGDREPRKGLCLEEGEMGVFA